jgi:hypothetical protein
MGIRKQLMRQVRILQALWLEKDQEPDETGRASEGERHVFKEEKSIIPGAKQFL